jgi:hypothetical protein
MRRILAVLTAATVTTTVLVAGPAQAAPRTVDGQPCPDAPGIDCAAVER